MNASGFRACVKELYETRYDPVSVGYVVLTDICDPGWDYFNGFCYFTSQTCANWTTALQKCRQEDSVLVDVNSNEENVYLQHRHNGAKSWLGLNDRFVEGNFTWADRGEGNFTAWTQNQPNNFRGEDCVHALGVEHSYEWNDVRCSDCHQYTCKKDGLECYRDRVSCSAIRKYVSSVSGNYFIDPDGPGGLAPFTVYCDMSDKNGVGVTVVSHDSESRTHVNGYSSPGSYSRDIHYSGASLSQLASLTSVSSHCEQFIKYECYHSYIIYICHVILLRRRTGAEHHLAVTIEEALASFSEENTPSKNSDDIKVEAKSLSKEVSTQTDMSPSVDIGIQVDFGVQASQTVGTCEVSVQFPEDVVEEVMVDHPYCSKKTQDRPSRTVNEKENATIESGPETCSDDFQDISTVPQQVEEHVDSQCTETATASQSEYYPSDCSEDGLSQSSAVEVVINRQRTFIVYEDNLKELYRFCPNCGSPTITRNEVQNEGSQLSVHLTCLNGCSYKWQSQPPCMALKVVSVGQVANSNVMEIKGFQDALFTVESQGIEVCVISTDRHSQISKEMRVNHPDKDHQYDPWHLAKSISKKLGSAANKKGCGELKPWIPSIINHLWWSATTCEGNPELLKEKWCSVIHHVTNRHEWPGNQHYHKCAHEPYTPEASRKKKWLTPGSAAHNALVEVIKDKRLLKDMEHLTKCVHTTLLEVYHSMYLKYLPKQMHFTHECMSKGTMLAALDHNKNVNRPQATIKEGDHKGEPRFKISWNKVTKRFGAEPVPQSKSFSYQLEMLDDIVTLARNDDQVNVHCELDRTHVMAPESRPPREEIIARRLEMSRF
ncbi:hypothetical protein ACROYT_G012151 [Oculina patagonica]